MKILPKHIIVLSTLILLTDIVLIAIYLKKGHRLSLKLQKPSLSHYLDLNAEEIKNKIYNNGKIIETLQDTKKVDNMTIWKHPGASSGIVYIYNGDTVFIHCHEKKYTKIFDESEFKARMSGFNEYTGEVLAEFSQRLCKKIYTSFYYGKIVIGDNSAHFYTDDGMSIAVNHESKEVVLDKLLF